MKKGDGEMEPFAQWALVPEMKELLERRFVVLSKIHRTGPVGRRKLAELCAMQEREIRAITDFLRESKCIHVEKEGMTVTSHGEDILRQLEPTMNEFIGRSLLSKRLQQQFGIQEVWVVEGNSDEQSEVKQELAERAATYLESLADADQQKVAVTGGTTIAAIPEQLSSHPLHQHFYFIAARGGVGDQFQHQANTIAAQFAEACHSPYKLFYYPDELSEEAHEVLKAEATSLEMIALYEQVDIVIHGVGQALQMAEKRKSSKETIRRLHEQHAVAEAFGYYFNEAGQVIERIRTIGIDLNQVHQAKAVLAVAGGQSKGQALFAYLKTAPSQTVLVTDEGAAEWILNQLT